VIYQKHQEGGKKLGRFAKKGDSDKHEGQGREKGYVLIAFTRSKEGGSKGREEDSPDSQLTQKRGKRAL